jgi:hypothetical protein
MDKDFAYNSTYPKGGVSCSKGSFVVNEKLVFKSRFVLESPAFAKGQNVAVIIK